MSRILLFAVVALLALPTAASAQKRDLYVSLGDSWAASVQGHPTGPARITRSGFTEQLVRQQRARGVRWRLARLGCPGLRSDEMIRGNTTDEQPCSGYEPPYRGTSPATSQLSYAERYLRRNRKRLALVTIVISGNDMNQCVRGTDANFDCINRELERMETDIPTIARRVRAATGRRVKIVALGYPDIYLSLWRDENTRFLAEASQDIFKDRWMPILRRGYRASRITFIDLNETFGSYGSLANADVNLPPYGMLPRPVATICAETWFCQRQDIHPKTSGYRRIATAIRRSLR